MKDPHVIELLPAYALDALEQSEARTVSAHLETCAQCRDELAAYQALIGPIALSAPAEVAPLGLKKRLLIRIRPAAESQRRPAPVSFWKRLWGTPRPLVLAGQ